MPAVSITSSDFPLYLILAESDEVDVVREDQVDAEDRETKDSRGIRAAYLYVKHPESSTDPGNFYNKHYNEKNYTLTLEGTTETEEDGL